MSSLLPVSYEGRPCYDIVIETDFSSLSDKIDGVSDKKYEKICVVTDTNVAKLYLNEVEASCRSTGREVTSFVFEAGEASKHLDTVQKLYEHLIIQHFDRKSLLLALGGGVVGDLTGYTAATFLRGIDFIQVPTTLLSQVDSSIGGKTGVDFLQYKNMIGAFYMPRLVYINIATLQSLPQVQFTSGMGEVVKHGLIRDRDYFVWLREHRDKILAKDNKTMETMVEWSCRIKRDVVEKDPREQNIRAYLNFGHTIGHAIEKLSDFSLCHGHCVALGMYGALLLSKKAGTITQEEYQEAVDGIAAFGLPRMTEGLDAADVLLATKSDKKMAGGRIRFVILEAVGRAAIKTDVTDDMLLDAIRDVLRSEERS